MPETRRHAAPSPSYRAFLAAFFRDRKTVGAVAPTSRGVAKRMARLGRVRAAKNVAELGPGTGAITHSLLRALPKDGRLWGFEVYEPFVEHLRETYGNDPRLIVVPESAEEVRSVREREAPEGMDAIISSVPFSLLGEEQTLAILRSVSDSLRPGGFFVALQYHPRFLAPLMREVFPVMRREVYPWNIPPALLLSARTARIGE